MKCRLASFVLFCLLVLRALGVTLEWDPSPDAWVSGYAIHYGTSGGNYTVRVDVGNTTTCTITNLNPGVTYFFVATAYTADGLESLPSNEVSYTVPGGNPLDTIQLEFLDMPPPFPGSVTLAWDPILESWVSGYAVRFGWASGYYTNRTDVGTNTTCTITNLMTGSTYFFVAHAYTSDGQENPPSNEIGYRVPPPGLNNKPAQVSKVWVVP